MAKFLTGNELNSELEKIFEKAEKQIILISPYIKLHERYASTLRTKKNNPDIKLTIVFGKNEGDLSKSMHLEDFNFFKDFPNIEIRHEKRLHAKYYANETSAILTSMNLYNFSQDVNIEAGVLTTATIVGNLTSNLMTNITGEENFDRTAFAYFSRVIEQSVLLFKKTPVYEKSLMGFGKKYRSSNIEIDTLTDFFANKIKYDNTKVKDNYTKNSGLSQQMVKSEPQTSTPFNISSDTKFLSTTALSKEMGISTKELYSRFEKLNWIERIKDEWSLTPAGSEKGAQLKKGQYGEYISWPATVIESIK